MSTAGVGIGSRARSRLTWLREQPERGSITVELVLAFPVLLLLVLLAAQFMLFYFGSEAAHTAAAQAVAVARAQNATTASGQVQGQSILDNVAGGTLPQRQITITRGAGEAIADVTGTVQSLIPGFHLHVSAHAAAPIEAWSKN
ncbi:TadE/TadG family type IV pilus assembly protein [Catenulispora rubra]|uniref:TadE/TadG family type IV pilus assembly protein n=1 Tax=Catenulispora rubra TaxID=280293 RepID=UPI00189218C8|nr:TadE/TadG family type IV pilus assembly protein [Catenulispora rubra]